MHLRARISKKTNITEARRLKKRGKKITKTSLHNVSISNYDQSQSCHTPATLYHSICVNSTVNSTVGAWSRFVLK